MSDLLREFILPLLFISIAIGYQVFFYFLYQYLKGRKEKLELNKTLLAYVSIFGLTLTGYMIRVINIYFIQELDFELFQLITKISFILLFSSLIVFLLITSSKPFKKIVKVGINRIIACLIFMPIFFIFFFETNSPIFMLTTLFTLIISFSYVFFFHFKLIRFSTGSVKKRLNLIVFGFILCTVQLFIGGYIPAYILLKDYSSILQLIAAPIFITGLLIIFFGIYRFPAFLEFNWKENLINLFIINKTNYELIQIYNFKENNNTIFVPQDGTNLGNVSKTFYSSGILGIEHAISRITDTGDTHIEKIEQGKLLIILKLGDTPFDHLLYCLVVEKDMKSYIWLLNRIKNQFQEFYGKILLRLEKLEKKKIEFFTSFNIEIKKLLE